MLFFCPAGVIVRISFSPLAEARHSHQTCRMTSEKVRWIIVCTHKGGKQAFNQDCSQMLCWWRDLNRWSCWWEVTVGCIEPNPRFSFEWVLVKMSHSTGLVVLSNEIFGVFMLLSYLDLKWSFRGRACVPFLFSIFYSNLALHHHTEHVNIFLPFSFLNHFVKPKCLKLCMKQIL